MVDYNRGSCEYLGKRRARDMKPLKEKENSSAQQP